MRKIVGIFFIVVMASPIGAITAAPAGAATAGTTCKSYSGTGSFAPTLPKLGSSAKVKSVLTATGSIGSCSGSVSGGTFKFVSAKSAGENCTTLGTAPAVAIKGTQVITWSTGKTSTISIKLSEVPLTPVTTRSMTGTVTAGLFQGLHLKGKVMYAVLNGGCVSSGLSKISLQASGPIIIR
jgi:hypothetical protein